MIIYCIHNILPVDSLKDKERVSTQCSLALLTLPVEFEFRDQFRVQFVACETLNCAICTLKLLKMGFFWNVVDSPFNCGGSAKTRGREKSADITEIILVVVILRVLTLLLKSD